MFRELCEAYPGVDPLRLQEMTLDQILLLACPKKLLRNPRTIKGTPEELIAMGLLEHSSKIPRGKSVSEHLREQKQIKEKAEARRQKKERRRKRLALVERMKKDSGNQAG